MKQITVKLKTPARDGNTCYRPDGGSSELHDAFREVIADLELDLDLFFEETLLAGSEGHNRPRLFIEGRELSGWLGDMEKHYRKKFRAEVKPAMESGRFNPLIEDNYLKEVIRFIVTQTSDNVSEEYQI